MLIKLFTVSLLLAIWHSSERLWHTPFALSTYYIMHSDTYPSFPAYNLYRYSLYGRYVRKQIQDVLLVDPYLIDCRPVLHSIECPCLILSATNDDYIPAQHGLDVLAGLTSVAASYRSFRGGHFGPRPRLLVMSPLEFIMSHSAVVSRPSPVGPYTTSSAMIGSNGAAFGLLSRHAMSSKTPPAGPAAAAAALSKDAACGRGSVPGSAVGGAGWGTAVPDAGCDKKGPNLHPVDSSLALSDFFNREKPA